MCLPAIALHMILFDIESSDVILKSDQTQSIGGFYLQLAGNGSADDLKHGIMLDGYIMFDDLKMNDAPLPIDVAIFLLITMTLVLDIPFPLMNTDFFTFIEVSVMKLMKNHHTEQSRQLKKHLKLA